LKDLLKEIQEDPSKLDSLNEEQVRELRKEILPYNQVTGVVDDKFTVFSLTNLQEEYMKRMTCISFAGFIYKMLEEFDLEEHPQLDDMFKGADIESFRTLAKGFLGTIFEYNPEDHVRPLKNEQVKEKSALSQAKREELKIPMPPADTMIRFTRYMDNHYEQLRDITSIVYGITPDFEDAIQIMGTFDSEEGAKEFREKYQDDFTSQVKVLQHGKWGLTGAWEQNRDRMEYLNEHTQFLKEVMDRLDQDEKLGQDMMKKRIKKLKKRDIQKTGPDPKSLSQYASATGKKLDRLGAERVELSPEEKEAIQKAENKKPLSKLSVAQSAEVESSGTGTGADAPKVYQHGEIVEANFEEDDECPDDAVEVNVTEISKGGKQVQTSKFYTEADKDDAIKKHADEIQKTRASPFTGAPAAQDRTAKTKSKITVPGSSKLTLGPKK